MAEPEKSCEGIHPLLLDFVLGELEKDGAEHARVLKHLASCEDCQQRAGELKRTTRMLQAVGRRSEPDPAFENHVAQLAHAEAAQVREISSRSLDAVSRATPRPRTPWWILPAAAAIGVALAWAVSASGLLSRPPGAEIEPHAGAVEVAAPGGPWRCARVREELPAGAAVRVRGAGLAQLDLGGSPALLGPEAELALPGRRGAAARLAAGNAFFEKPGAAVEAAGCRIEGPDARFAVSINADSRLSVASVSGSVRVRGRMGSVTLIRHEETRLDASGRLTPPRAAGAADLAPWRFALAGTAALQEVLGPSAEFLEDGRVRLGLDLKNAHEPGTRWEDLFPTAGKGPWLVYKGWLKADGPGALALKLPLVAPASVELTLRPGQAAAGVGFMTSPDRCWLYQPGTKEARGAATHRLDQGPLKGLRTVLASGEPFKRSESLRARVVLSENHIEVFASAHAVNRADLGELRAPVRVVLFARGRCAFSDFTVVGYLDPDWAERRLGGKAGPPAPPVPAAPVAPVAPPPAPPEEPPAGAEGEMPRDVF